MPDAKKNELKPWQKQGWIIQPGADAAFVAQMEQVLDVYKRPYDPEYPVVCMDEMPRQLIGEIATPIQPAPGRMERHDYEYKRNGTCDVFIANEPLGGWRMAKVTEQRTKTDWAEFTAEIAERYPDAKKITLVMDNLNTHAPSSWYESFPPEKAKAIWDRFELVYTPKHGSWLNMAEIELNVLAGQCLKRRIGDIDTMRKEVAAWTKERNEDSASIDWRFTTEDARIKLKRLYPKL